MSSCRPEAPGPARDRSPIQTDSVVYHLTEWNGGYAGTAEATYVNRTGAPVPFARCGSLMHWRRRTGPDSTRELFSDEAYVCAGGEPAGVIAPGGRVTVRLRLGSLSQPNMQPPLRPEHLTGRMRVVFKLCVAPQTHSDSCVPLPMAERQSNAFDVRL